MKAVKKKPTYKELLLAIGVILKAARQKAIYAVNINLVAANWEIGRHIVEFEQAGNERAEYGTALLARLSTDLTRLYGKGFGRRNVLDMRRFYLTYQKRQTLSAKLNWSHYINLLGVSDDKARNFYEQQTINEKLSVRDLKRQIDSSLFERLALSKDKKGILQLAKKGHVVADVADAVKDPFVLNFLKIRQSHKITERGLEQRIIDKLQLFLLELGKGYAFVARQYQIPIRNKHHSVDLVFYNRILKCFVLIDLKIRGVEHTDIGQMNFYLNYFKAEENVKDDNEPIGIILSAEKDEVLVEYALGGLSNKIFVSKYQLYLPDKKQIQLKVKEIMSDR